MEKPIDAISSLVKLRSYYQSQYEHYLAKATASKENKERVSLLLQDLSDSEVVEEAFWEEKDDEPEQIETEQNWLSFNSHPTEQLHSTETSEQNITDVQRAISAVKALNEAMEIIGSVSESESGKTLHLNYFQKLLEQEMSRSINLEVVKLYLDEGVKRGYLVCDRFDPNCYKPCGTIPKSNKGEKIESGKSENSSEGLSGNSVVVYKDEEREIEKGEENSSSTHKGAYKLPPSPKLKATLIETIQEYLESETPRRFSIRNVINYLYSTKQQQSWSRETKNKVGSCISNVLSRKAYLNKEWKRIKPGMYQPIRQK